MWVIGMALRYIDWSPAARLRPASPRGAFTATAANPPRSAPLIP